MTVKFFGQFLLEKGVISREQLLSALDYQEQNNLRFGEYAVKHGYLTTGQLDILRDLQKREDLRVGELAIKQGFVSPEKVQEILIRQRNDYMPLGRALVEKGILSQGRIDEALDAFQADQGRAVAATVRVEEDVPVAPVLAALADMTEKMFLRVVNLPVKTQGVLKMVEKPQGLAHTCAIHLSGDVALDYVLAVSTDIAEKIYTSLVQDKPRNNKDCNDGIAEFANIVCGNAVSRLAQMGLAVQMDPPKALQADDTYFMRQWTFQATCPVFTPTGEIRTLFLLS